MLALLAAIRADNWRMGTSSQWKAPPGWRKTRERVFRVYGRRCWRCGRAAGTVGHVVARVLGGSDDISNLRPECGPCNYGDGARIKNRMYPQTPPWLRGRPAARPRPQPMRSSRDW